MAYAAPADLLDYESAADLAEAVAPDDDIPADTLAAVLKDQDLTDLAEADLAIAREIVTTIGNYIAIADATINSHIGSWYPQLVTQPHPANADLLKGICISLLRWNIFGGDRDSDRRKNLDAATADLGRIGKGDMILTCPTGGIEESGAQAESDVQQFQTGVGW